MRITHKQRGSVLLFSLLILFLTAVISTTLLRNSSLDLQMATNEQLKLDALQKAESITDALYDLFESGDADGYLLSVGDRVCIVGDTNPDCLSTINIALPTDVNTMVTADGVTPVYYARHMAEKVPASSIMQEGTAGTESYDLYEIYVTYDGTAKGLGKAEIAQGVVISYVEGTSQERRDNDTSLVRSRNSRS